MDIQVGDRITYRFIDKDGIFTEIVGSNNLSLTSIHWFKEHLEDKEIEIIKIERPKYEVVEENKELLTEEEKEFLIDIIKYYSDVTEIEFGFTTSGIDIYNSQDNIVASMNYPYNLGFQMVLKNKSYTLKELGLEVINGG